MIPFITKPSIADVLEFKGAKMECAIEATPHEETCIYSSILEGGNLMQKFEEGELQNTVADGVEVDLLDCRIPHQYHHGLGQCHIIQLWWA